MSAVSQVDAELIEIPGGQLTLCQSWMPDRDAENLFLQLQDELVWESSTIRLFGKAHKIPRLNAWYGDPGAAYTYSRIRFEPRPWTPSLADLRARIQEATGYRFNGVLANLYRDGRDSNGWHSDDEPELGASPVVASFSLGAERGFHLRHRYLADADRVRLVLQSGSLLLMSGETQKNWMHQVPKTKRVVGPRINLTFRYVI